MKKSDSKMTPTNAEILGVSFLSTSADLVLEKIIGYCRESSQPRLIFTPNPEFLVAAYCQPEFRRILGRADINWPESFGLVLAGKILGQPIAERIGGASLVEKLLETGNEEKWKVGIVGARQDDPAESEIVFMRLRQKYPSVSFDNLGSENPKQNTSFFNLVLACQGMIKQEKWILENKDRIKAKVFMGIGGSLDFLTGFACRAPVWVQKTGFEWLWRGLQKPSHWKRLWKAVVVFPWLVLREKFSSNNF